MPFIARFSLAVSDRAEAPGGAIISFRIRADIKDASQKPASADRRSLSQYIELALEAHIEAAERKQQRKTPRS